MVNEWVPIVGTLGGVLAGGAVTWWLERARWKREDRTRWYQDRRQVYARFLQAADDYAVAGRAFADELAIQIDKGRSLPPGEIEPLERLSLAAEKLRPFEWEIEILGGPDVRAAASRLVRLAGRQVAAEQRAVLATNPKAGAEAKAAAAEAVKAVEEFKQAARAEIGLRRSE